MKAFLTRDNLDEIVFERRNKNYGAYQLRSGYHATLNRSLLITLSALAIFTTLLLLFRRTPAPATGKRDDIVTLVNLDPKAPLPPVQETTAKPPVRTAGPPVTAPAENTYRVVERVPDVPVVTEPTGPDPMAATGSGTTTAGDPSGTTLATGNGLESSILPPAAIEAIFADQAPEFPGGMERFYKYLRNNLAYTARAREIGIVGKVYANFVVNAEGKIIDVKIMKGLGYGLDEQVLAALNNSPAWKPGIYRGNPVSVIIRLPVNFQLGK